MQVNICRYQTRDALLPVTLNGFNQGRVASVVYDGNVCPLAKKLANDFVGASHTCYQQWCVAIFVAFFNVCAKLDHCPHNVDIRVSSCQ